MLQEELQRQRSIATDRTRENDELRAQIEVLCSP